MGRDQIQSLKKELDQLFLALEMGEFEKLKSGFQKIREYPLSQLNEEQKRALLSSLQQLEQMAKEKKSKLLKELQEKEALLKFKF